MKPPIIIIGMGELGGVFARAFLKNDFPVYPIGRKTDMAEAAARIPSPALVLVAVGEDALDPVLKNMPDWWKTKVGMVQNELLPYIWESAGIDDPTVVSVWFEKKPGRDYHVFLPSPVYGPQAEPVAASLGALDIPCRLLSDQDDLVFSLAAKNVYVLTLNIAGLKTGGTAGRLWTDHRRLVLDAAGDIIDLQERLTGATLDRKKLLEALTAGIESEPTHACCGRSSPRRLTRTIALADRLDLAVPTIRTIDADYRK